MHYHCEIILPPETDDIDAAVASVMRRFDENLDDSDEDYSPGYSFWDFYVIGGRWAGTKLVAQYDSAKVQEFYDWCNSEKITVSGIKCGKDRLEPESQIEKVDNKWNELFPQDSNVIVACPLFAHSNDQYGRNGNGTIEGDISKLGDSKEVKCSRIIFAGSSYSTETKEYDGPLEPAFMLVDSEWNGVNHMDVKWDGTIGSALDQWNEKLERYVEFYRQQVQPNDDWLCVTVDYHS